MKRPPRNWFIAVGTVALAVFVGVVVAHTLDSDTDLSRRMCLALASAQAAAVLATMWLPLLGWVLALSAALTSAVAAAPQTPWVDATFNALLVVLALVGMRVSGRVAATVWALTAVAALGLAGQRTALDRWSAAIASIVLYGLVLTTAAALRALVDARRTAAEKSADAATERERTALLEERTRIARELHDVVAHHMSVVAIQAEAGRFRVPDPPPELLETLAAIRRSATAALAEMRMMLGVLRDADAATAPQPTIDDVADLVDGLRAAGSDATLTIVGRRRPLPAGVEVSAYRIVQEALSNAVRHAPGTSIAIRLDYGPDRIAAEIVNSAAVVRRGGTSDDGHGLLGMRERVALHRGSLDTGRTSDGGYRVRAVLQVSP